MKQDLLTMNEEQALKECTELTYEYWKDLNELDAVDLLQVFRAYIRNGYDDKGIVIPMRIKPVWPLCISSIEKKIRK